VTDDRSSKGVKGSKGTAKDGKGIAKRHNSTGERKGEETITRVVIKERREPDLIEGRNDESLRQRRACSR
jgi:hypothetical protein